MSSFLMAIGISEFVTQTLKVVIRRRRPNFYELCGFDMNSRTCNGPLEHVKEAQYSFPSGHSSLAACAMVYMSWMVLARIVAHPKLSISHKRQFSFGACVLFLGWAVFVGTTRLIDHWHHFSDVVAGLWLGGMIATLVFHFHYPPFSVIPWIRRDSTTTSNPHGSALPIPLEQPSSW
jgi:phosphatidate phosphatase